MTPSDSPAGDDRLLLLSFAEKADQAAFATLVERYTGLVYGTALRKCGEPDWAADVTQNVFVALARKAGALGRDTGFVSAGGWLHRAAALETRRILRDRLKQRNRQAAMIHELSSEAGAPGEIQEAALAALAPRMDDALGRLAPADREVIVCRFYEQLGFGEIAARLGIGEDTARKRCSRSLEKLGRLFGGRSAQVSSVVVAALLSREFARAAPASLAARISSAAAAAAASTPAATSFLTLFVTMTLTSKQILLGGAVVAALLLAFGVARYSSGPGGGQPSSAPDPALAETPVKPPAAPERIAVKADTRSPGARLPTAAAVDPVEALVSRMRTLCDEREAVLAEARERMGAGGDFATMRPFLVRLEQIDTALRAEAKALDRTSLDAAVKLLSGQPEDPARKRSLSALLEIRAASDPAGTLETAKSLGTWATDAALRGWGSADPQAALEYQRSLAGGDQKVSREALLRIYDGWVAVDPATAIGSLGALSYDDQKAARRAFDDHLQSESRRPKLLAAVAATEDEAVRIDLATEFSKSWGRMDPEQASTWLDSLPVTDRQSVLAAAKSIAEGFARSGQPANGADWLWPQLPEAGRAEFVKTYVEEKWAAKDPQAAKAWLQSHGIEPVKP